MSSLPMLLVVHPDQVLRQQLATSFNHIGYEVCTATPGAEAISAVEKQTGLGFVLTDVSDAEGYGVELIESVAALPLACRPVVATMGIMPMKPVAELLARGAVEFFRHPVVPTEVNRLFEHAAVPKDVAWAKPAKERPDQVLIYRLGSWDEALQNGDISLGHLGIFLATFDQLQVGTKVHVTLGFMTGPVSELKFRATVRWVRDTQTRFFFAGAALAIDWCEHRTLEFMLKQIGTLADATMLPLGARPSCGAAAAPRQGREAPNQQSPAFEATRQFPRFERHLHVTLVKYQGAVPNFYKGVTANVSRGGAFVSMQDCPFAESERVFMRLSPTPGGWPCVAGEAVVRWKGGVNPVGFGLEFMAIEMPAKEQLEAMIGESGESSVTAP